MALRPGDRVEHFAILSLLGQGGMGQVYAARDMRLDRTVALKIVQPTPTGSESERESTGAARLLREARAVAALEHPNVVTIYEIGSIREGEPAVRPFIAMELVRGKSLRAYVGDESVPVPTRVRWLQDAARALDAAHRAGIIHRDMKPENVMVRDDGVVKVLDFGIAKRASQPVGPESTTSAEAQLLPNLTERGVAVGTPHYMAPEQMRREDLDGRADQFSWAVVAYELLSGVMPWGLDSDALELVAKLLTESPKPLSELRPDLPPHVADVIARAMAKRRADRFASMDEIVRALDDRDARLTSPDVAAPKVRSSAPRTTRARIAMLAVVLVAASAVALAWKGRAAAPIAATTPAAAVACRSATECVAKLGGKPAVCNRAGACVAIDDARCKAAYEPDDLKRDDVVWVGSMFPLSRATSSYGVSNSQAVELARRDFAAASRGLRTPGKSDGPPPIAVVTCDDALGSDDVAAHLARDLEVPAVIGFGGGESLGLASSWFVPNGTLVVASITQSPLLARVPQPEGAARLVWRTTYDNVETAEAIAASASRLETRLRGAGALRTGERMRVAVVHSKDPSNTAFAEVLFKSLVINGKPAIANEEDYREMSVDWQPTKEDHASVIATIVQFAPTLIVSAANSDLVAEIEAAWPKAKRRPYYQTSGGIDDELLRFIGTSADRRARVAGFTSVSSTQPNARFVLHYNETFGDEITRTLAPNSSFDAFYLIAYAAYALAGRPATGEHLGEAIGRLLPPGEPIDVGPTGVLGAYGAFRKGRNIDLNGATGSLDFDVSTGDAPVDLAALCASVDATGRANGSIESGVVYVAKERRLVNEARCP